jgi:Mce-associated membrane protein
MSVYAEPGDAFAPAATQGGRGGTVGLVVLVLLTIGSLVFGSLSYLHWKDLRDANTARADAKAAAAEAIPAFTSFDYHHLDADIKRARQILTPCFGAQYAATLEQAVPQATQAQAVVTDVVEGAQVLDLKGSLAHVQVFFDQKASFGDGRPTKVTPYRVVVDMVKRKGTWQVNFLDLDDAGATGARPCENDGVTKTKS